MSFRIPDAKERSDKAALSFIGPSLAVQASKEECDINLIMAKYKRDGVITHVQRNPGQYRDLLDAPTNFQIAMNIVREGQESFSSLPAQLRKRFNNDPHAFLEFVGDPNNLEEARKLGLLKPADKKPTKEAAPGGAYPGGKAEPEKAKPETSSGGKSEQPDGKS